MNLSPALIKRSVLEVGSIDEKEREKEGGTKSTSHVSKTNRTIE